MKHYTVPLRLAVLGALAVAGLFALSARSADTVLAVGCNIAQSSAAIDAPEQEMLNLINQHRDANDQPPLQFSDTLNKAAALKSKHMADNSYFAHDDLPKGRSWVQRIRDCGYTYNTYIGENIAAGNETANATFLQWRNSSGHNANMLHPVYTVIGIGRAYNSAAPWDWYWTTEFGGYNDGYSGGTPPAPTPTRTPTATPTRTPTAGPPPPAGVRLPGTPPDNDHDGCSNARELSADPEMGGARNPNSYWDFFDAPNAANQYDGSIDMNNDVFGVLVRFGKSDNGGTASVNRNTNPLSAPSGYNYHPAFDRSAASLGAPAWKVGPPDGEIDLFGDVFGMAAQFGHTCM